MASSLRGTPINDKESSISKLVKLLIVAWRVDRERGSRRRIIIMSVCCVVAMSLSLFLGVRPSIGISDLATELGAEKLEADGQASNQTEQ